MDVSDAAALIAPGIRTTGGTWADLGAGSGTFARALSSLVGSAGRVYAVERDRAALESLDVNASRMRDGAAITVVHADFTQSLDLPKLDGVLLANSLHFVNAKEQLRVLQRIARLLVPTGRVLVVEYERRAASRWVPFPIAFERLGELAAATGFAPPQRIASAPSLYGGTLYVAAMDRDVHSSLG